MMAIETSFSVSLRYFLLIGLLILIIHTLSSDYGVNGEDQLAPKPKTADDGVPGAKDSEPSEPRQKPPGKKKLRKKTSLSPTGSITVRPAVADPELPSEPKEGPPKPPRSPGANSDVGRMGATGIQKTREATKDKNEDKVEDKVEGKDKNKDEDKGEEDNEKDTAGNKDEKPLNTGQSQAAADDRNKLPHKKPPTDDVSSAGSFMTYFVIIAIIVIIGYLILHNKKKLMGYIVEGRNTGRTRRQRPASSSNGSEYKPLKNADDAVSIGRPEET